MIQIKTMVRGFKKGQRLAIVDLNRDTNACRGLVHTECARESSMVFHNETQLYPISNLPQYETLKSEPCGICGCLKFGQTQEVWE